MWQPSFSRASSTSSARGGAVAATMSYGSGRPVAFREAEEEAAGLVTAAPAVARPAPEVTRRRYGFGAAVLAAAACAVQPNGRQGLRPRPEPYSKKR